MTIVEIVVQFHLFFAETVLLSSFSFSVCRINISFLECMLVYFKGRRWIRKDLQSTAELFLWCSLRQHTFAKPPQHQDIHNDYTDKKVRDPSSISKSKTSTVFLAKKLPYQQSGVEGEGGHLHTHHSVILTQKERQMKKQSSDTRAWYDYYNNWT